MPTVRIPTVLRKHTDGASKIDVPGTTVGEVFATLVADHPGLADQLLEDGNVRGFINVYVEDEDMPAVAGGA